jgi:hypothetical protein
LTIVVGTAVQSATIVDFAKNALGLAYSGMGEIKPCVKPDAEQPVADQVLSQQAGQMQILQSIKGELTGSEGVAADRLQTSSAARQMNYSIYFGRIFVSPQSNDCGSVKA